MLMNTASFTLPVVLMRPLKMKTHKADQLLLLWGALIPSIPHPWPTLKTKWTAKLQPRNEKIFHNDINSFIILTLSVEADEVELTWWWCTLCQPASTSERKSHHQKMKPRILVKQMSLLLSSKHALEIFGCLMVNEAQYHPLLLPKWGLKGSQCFRINFILKKKADTPNDSTVSQ